MKIAYWFHDAESVEILSERMADHILHFLLAGKDSWNRYQTLLAKSVIMLQITQSPYIHLFTHISHLLVGLLQLA